MATAVKSAKKESKRPLPAKTSFTSPFTPKWSPLPQEDMHFILKTLKDKLASMGLEKKEERGFRPWRRRKKHQKPADPSEPVPQESQGVRADVSPKTGWTDVAARGQLAIGINEVTKALERNELRLLLVCKSVRPQHMTDHLVALSTSRGVPACQVPRLSHSMSEPLGLRSVLALGFRRCASKDDEAFTDTVEAITPKVPRLDVAWLQGVGAKDAVGTKEEGGEKQGRKRKLESEPEAATEAAASCALQPLRVKKIVANPAKKRKIKKSQPAK